MNKLYIQKVVKKNILLEEYKTKRINPSYRPKSQTKREVRERRDIELRLESEKETLLGK
jgi:hypothetical protein